MSIKNIFKSYFLLIAVLFSIILGILIGSSNPPNFILNIFSAIGSLISEIINFCVPLIIIAFVAQGIASLETSSGKILGLTLSLSYFFMIIAATITFVLAINIFPNFFSSSVNFQETGKIATESNVSSGISKIEIKPIVEVIPAILISFILGLGISSLKAVNLKKIVNEFYKIIEILVKKVIISILPFYVLTNFVKLSSSGKFELIVGSLYKVFLFIILLNSLWLLFQFTIAGLISRKNPFVLLKNMLPVYLMAFATQSSAATIPVSIEASRKNGVSDAISNFVVPLCATIHLSGAIISIMSGTIAIMMLNGYEISLSVMVPFVFMLGIMMVAAPGVPCGGILAAVSLLVSFLNFSPSMIAIAIAFHMCQDNFGTACNVCGDTAISLIVDKFCKTKEL
ncbi:MAG: dicarboxylate/amino acid:cation symporter [Oscillospiraceae bacterium]|nr:dicarboxylate/amino acid:cation symporter [Oscillospiraceae bacterium]